MTHDVEIYEARHQTAHRRTDRAVDPVCGMELTDDDIVARLRVEGGEVPFCSTDCLQHYIAAARP